MKTEPKRKLRHDEESMLVFALRYCLDRETAAIEVCGSELVYSWSFLSEQTQDQIIREIEDRLDYKYSDRWKRILDNLIFRCED